MNDVPADNDTNRTATNRTGTNSTKADMSDYAEDTVLARVNEPSGNGLSDDEANQSPDDVTTEHVGDTVLARVNDPEGDKCATDDDNDARNS
jgi:hypothetical protein